MCTVCGCADGETRIETSATGDHGHEHVGPDGKVYRHSHDHHHPHADTHHHHTAAPDAGEHEHVGPDGRVFRHSHGHPHGHERSHDDDHPHSHAVPGHEHEHRHDHGHAHGHDHGHDHGPEALDFGRGPAGTEVPGMSQARLVTLERDILAKNAGYAAVNRQLLTARRVLALNLMSSPGSGKTTLLVRTLTDLAGRFPMAVIEGDQQTSFDAERIRATGTPALQINTGKGCHLDAQMVTQALGHLDVPEQAVLFVENVGNLVCPAGFDLGETARVVVLSVTEGEEKPLKYPAMFASADLLLVNKVDLLPHLSFDLDRMVGYARRLKPELPVLCVSASSGAGMADWYAWIEARRPAPVGG